MSPYQPHRFLVITLIFVMGLGLSLWLFFYFNKIERQRRMGVVQESTRMARSKLQSELKKIPLVISSLHLLFEQSDTVTRKTFQTFTVPFLRNLAGIRALEWAPYIPQAQRTAHEQQLQAEGFDWYGIRVPDPAKKWFKPAPIKPFYYPIQYIEPAPLNRIALGYDLSATPERLAAIELSQSSRRLVVSPPARLIQNPMGARSFMVVKTVHCDTVLGAVLSVYNAQAFVDTVLKDELAYLDFYLFDQTADGAPLYNSQYPDTLCPQASIVQPDWWPADTLSIGNRKWLLYCQPKSDFFIYPFPLEAYGFSSVGLLLTLMLVGILIFLENNNTRLEQKVARRTEQLHRANSEQAVLLKEIHHRVKNNLQVITGLLSLQASSITDPNIKALFGVSQYRINAMAMLHEQLYQSENLSTINYKVYLKQMVEQLIVSMKGRKHQIAVDWQISEHLHLNLDTAIPLGLLINELVTNSLKYGFPEAPKGQLYIHLLAQNYPDFLLLIGDDGVGFSTEITPKSTPSLGLKLVHQLARQLNGQVERLDQSQGTHYRIRFQEVQ